MRSFHFPPNANLYDPTDLPPTLSHTNNIKLMCLSTFKIQKDCWMGKEEEMGE